MPLMHQQNFRSLECDISIEDAHASVTIQLEAGSYWATATVQDDDEIIAIRDWFTEYCKRANIGQ